MWILLCWQNHHRSTLNADFYSPQSQRCSVWHRAGICKHRLSQPVQFSTSILSHSGVSGSLVTEEAENQQANKWGVEIFTAQRSKREPSYSPTRCHTAATKIGSLPRFEAFPWLPELILLYPHFPFQPLDIHRPTAIPKLFFFLGQVAWHEGYKT